MKKKALLLVLSAALLVAASIGGTLAWLSDSSETLTNTFTAGDVEITLEETTGEDYVLVPGAEIDKDPMVTVLAGSEDCYVFVKVTNPLGDGVALDIDTTKWLQVDGIGGLAADETVYKYYQVVSKSTATPPVDTELPVFTTVTVDEDMGTEDKPLPSGDIIITAYAVQADNLTVTGDAAIYALAAA